MKKGITLILWFFIILIFASCAKSNNKSFSMGGSTTVEPIMMSAIEAYAKIKTDVKFNYESQGSSAGIQGVLDGNYILGASSRDLKTDEKSKGIKEMPLALDGIAIIVNGDVPLDNLTRLQIAQIFSGKIKNWNELKGPDEKIILINRDEASGTRGSFQELVLHAELGQTAEFAADAITTNSNGDLVTKVGSTPYSIGYCGFGYINQAKNARAKTLLVNGIEAIESNVLNKTYTVSRSLILVYKEELSVNKEIKEFVDFLLSAKGEEIIKKSGFIPLP